MLRWLPRLLRERREIQARRAISAREFAAGAASRASTRPTSAPPGARGYCGPLLAGYWRVALGLLGASAAA